MDTDGPGIDPPLHELGDEALLERLREMFERRDPVPSWAVEVAKLSLELHAIDAELAELTQDAADELAAVAVRSDGGGRTATFESSDLVIEIEVTGSGPSLGVVGQLVPATPARIEVRQPRVRRRWVDADELGRFAVDDVRRGPLSLICHRPGFRPTATSWVIAE